MMHIPITVVNLKSDREKKHAMVAEFQKLGIDDYEFLEAVDGDNLSDSEIAKIYNREKTLKIFKRPLSKGELGCALSHFKIYQKMISENIEAMIILEDDVKLGSNFLKIEKYAAQLPKRWEIVFLGYDARSYEFFRLQYKYRITKKSPFAVSCFALFGSFAYLLRRSGAQKLLNAARPLFRPLDLCIHDKNSLNVYLLEKPSVMVDFHNSKIEKSRFEMTAKMQNPPSVPVKILQKIVGEKFYRTLENLMKKRHNSNLYHLAKKMYYAAKTRGCQILAFGKHR